MASREATELLQHRLLEDCLNSYSSPERTRPENASQHVNVHTQ